MNAVHFSPYASHCASKQLTITELLLLSQLLMYHTHGLLKMSLCMCHSLSWWSYKSPFSALTVSCCIGWRTVQAVTVWWRNLLFFNPVFHCKCVLAFNLNGKSSNGTVTTEKVNHTYILLKVKAAAKYVDVPVSAALFRIVCGYSVHASVQWLLCDYIWSILLAHATISVSASFVISCNLWCPTLPSVWAQSFGMPSLSKKTNMQVINAV